jgi:hypothetical protein
MILGAGMISSTTFYESYAVVDYPDTQSKIRITISYTNDASITHTILASGNQKYTISQEYSWSTGNFTRFNLQGYSIDDGPLVPIQRLSYGNFTLDILTDSNHSIVFQAEPQFKIITSELNKIVFYPPSPTNDNWFDADSDIQIIVPHILQSNQEDTRQQLSGWSLDNSDINIISRQESGNFTSHVIHMSSMHKIDLEYTTQYHVKVISNFGRALGAGWYDHGIIASISVIPSNDILVKHIFRGWQGEVIGSENQESVGVLVDSPKTVVANWFEDYTNVSMIGIITISFVVLISIYRKRRTSKI